MKRRIEHYIEFAEIALRVAELADRRNANKIASDMLTLAAAMLETYAPPRVTIENNKAERSVLVATDFQQAPCS